MNQEIGMREIKTGVQKIKWARKWLYSTILVLLLGGLAAGYPLVYKPRIEAKNYASFAAITVCGVENKLQAFDAAGAGERAGIADSFERLRSNFYAIDCPAGGRAEEIQWKMAKLFEYSRAYIEFKEKYTNEERADASRMLGERITDIKWLINDTIAYGNFGRLK
jgi:hypothetical protein